MLTKKDVIFLYNYFTDNEINKHNIDMDINSLSISFDENVNTWLENLGWSQENIKKDESRYRRVKYAFEQLLFKKDLREIIE